MTDVPDPGLGAWEVARRLGIAVTTVRTWDQRYRLGPSSRGPGIIAGIATVISPGSSSCAGALSGA